MTTLSTISAKPGITRIAGIDVDQLLHDIGDASAKDSAAELFGLLPSAQRVLVAVQADSDCAATPAEAKLLAMYRATNDGGRRDTLLAVEALARVSPRQRPALKLVPVSEHQHGGSR